MTSQIVNEKIGKSGLDLEGSEIPEEIRIKVLGNTIPHEVVRKTFFKFVEIFNKQRYAPIGKNQEPLPSTSIVQVRSTNKHVSAIILIDGVIRESTYERMAKFEGRESWGLRCFGSIEVIDGYLGLHISSLDYDPEATTQKKESKN